MKRIALVLLIFIVVAGAAFSFDPTTFPSPIQPGNILVSPAFHLGGHSFNLPSGYSYGSAFGLGISAAIDYALPIPFALSVGGELGIIMAPGSVMTPMGIPILARIAWHPNFEVPNLDTYIRFKMGGNIGFALDSNWKSGGGFAWGINFGARYFVSPTIAPFAELGFTQYGFKIKEAGLLRNLSWPSYMFNIFTFGVTIRI